MLGVSTVQQVCCNRFMRMSEKGVGSPGAGVACVCGPSCVGAGNWEASSARATAAF